MGVLCGEGCRLCNATGKTENSQGGGACYTIYLLAGLHRITGCPGRRKTHPSVGCMADPGQCPRNLHLSPLHVTRCGTRRGQGFPPGASMAVHDLAEPVAKYAGTETDVGRRHLLSSARRARLHRGFSGSDGPTRPTTARPRARYPLSVEKCRVWSRRSLPRLSNNDVPAFGLGRVSRLLSELSHHVILHSYAGPQMTAIAIMYNAVGHCKSSETYLYEQESLARPLQN